MKLDKLENIVLVLFGGATFLGGALFIITNNVENILLASFSFSLMMFIPLLLRFAALKYFLTSKYPELLDFKNFDFDKLQKEYKLKRDSK